jgi:quinol monooxygenase YgiN
VYVVTVEFVVNPETWDAFLPLMVDNARQSRTTEPGCRQFDVCTDPQVSATVFLYELYDDRAAFDAHLATPHYLAFAAATREMITGRTIRHWRRADPAP